MTTPATPQEDIIAKFTREYLETVPEKVRVLTELINKMKTKIDLDTLKEFRMHIHKIAGSAGTYGFKTVSDLCRQFEKDLIEKVEHFEERPGEPAWIPEFEAKFNQIKDAFTKKDTAG
jgi:HPt (histidine-containing phosphotransfer) domain-containing protein